MDPNRGRDPWRDGPSPNRKGDLNLRELRSLDQKDLTWKEGLAILAATYVGGKAIGSIFGSEENENSPSRLARAAQKLDDKQYNVFISHSWRYDDDYQGIVNLLSNIPSLDWQNHSVPEEKELETVTNEELENGLRNRMRNASVVITSAGMYGSEAYSTWIPREHEIAEELGKPIVAVKPEGQKNIPGYIEESADETVGWTRASVAQALGEYA
ncbi:TIR domain-containing protein [Halorientalis brevis]|uniref:TIR domain-containing protein n=1 Tax=Halorientalis brevis TaxID=1126241 RepID=A0ABD6CD79_9EURY|nr:TIR domain-containing protein [Halorientalis brevis]